MTQEISTKRPGARRRLVLAGAAVVLSLGAVGAAVGHAKAEGPMGWGHGPFGGHGLERFFKTVEATPEQREKITGILEEARKEIQPKAMELHERRGELFALTQAEPIDKAAFEDLRKEILLTLDEVSAKGLAAFLEAAETLTPEQRAELRESRRGWGGRGWGGPGWWN